MPTYEYACSSCGEHLEIVQSFRDDALTTCPNCGGPLRKVFGAIGVVFKGSGFYKTDSRPAKGSSKGDGSSTAATASSTDSGSASGSDKSTSGDAKPSSSEKSSKSAAKSSDGKSGDAKKPKTPSAGSKPGAAAAS